MRDNQVKARGGSLIFVTLSKDGHVGNDAASPFVAALGTGMLYKATTGPKTMILAGGLGAAVMMSYTFGSKYLPINYAKEIFF